MAIFPEYESFDALGLAELIKKNAISPLEILDSAILTIEKYNPSLNAVIHKLYDHAKIAVSNVSRESLFQGVPFLLKDLITDCAGTPLENGSRLTQGKISQSDSELVKLIKNSGLIILGKTNTPEFGLSSTTEPELNGPTRNPWDLQYSAGGSSGGGAAAVAARMVPMAHASDGGGSIRIPAACCGAFGLKISRGRAPESSPFVWQNLLVEHVITRSVRDSAAMLDVVTKSNSHFLTALNNPLKPLKIAFSNTPLFSSQIGETEKFFLKKTAELCEQLGHIIIEKTPPLASNDIPLAFMILLSAEISLGIDLLAASMRKKVNLDQVEIPTALLYKTAEQLSAKDFAWAMYTLQMAGNEHIKFYQNFDMLLTPVLPNGIPIIGAQKLNKTEKWYFEILRHLPSNPMLKPTLREMSSRIFGQIPFTPLANISGQPAMSVPLFMDKNNLPVGMHFTGKLNDEARLLQLASQLEQALPWKDRRPLF